MPIGKYIYCTKASGSCSKRYTVTNAYRQVHLLYPLWGGPPGREVTVTNAYRQVHLLYQRISSTSGSLTVVTNAYRQVHLLYRSEKQLIIVGTNLSQMPIGKYIYCT